MKTRPPVAILNWIWLCAFLNCAGWGLSALHQLNAAGYAVTLALGATAFFIWQKKSGGPVFPRWQKINRRFRRTFPLAFLILAVLALLGGILYAPTNYDGLAYRLPRILHWLAADQWHWIQTVFPRVNGRACGIEWVSAPLLALLQTDRLLFLINTISFLLLPGLIFSVFTRLGVRRRVAWHWMWIAPTGYGFLLQAGSIGNDLFGAPFALAALDFALRAKASRSHRDLFASVLAAALLTGAKTSNLPLLLPWAIAIWPALNLLRRSLLAAAAIGLVALFSSALPILVFNAHYYHGDWAGLSAEGDKKSGDIILRTAANAALLTVQNLTPPVFPAAGAWNRAVQENIPADLSRRLHRNVAESGAAEFRTEELQIEESAGLGFGVTVLLILSVFAARGISLAGGFASIELAWLAAVRFAVWLSLLALLSQSAVYPIGRIVIPYYALLLPLLLVGAAPEKIVARRWWRLSAFAVFIIAAGLLVVSPARPLFPVELFLKKIHGAVARYPALARVETVYSVYHVRNDAFAPVRAALPPDWKVLGLITYDDPETSLWHPFGSRRIEHVCPGDTAADLKARGVEYILLRDQAFGQCFHSPFAVWLQQMNAQIVAKIPLNLRAAAGPLDWYLVRLN